MAMPTGQVLVWHLRIMMQPIVISGAVANLHARSPWSAGTRATHALTLASMSQNRAIRTVNEMQATWAHVTVSSHTRNTAGHLKQSKRCPLHSTIEQTSKT